MTVSDFAHFKVLEDGTRYAGDHFLVELWNAKNLTDADYIDSTLINAAETTGATVLHSHFHSFGEGQGVSGVVVLAESHISIHTWPEYGYAAIDIFMCGDCDPAQALPVLEKRFSPQRLEHQKICRGEVSFPTFAKKAIGA